MAGGEEARVTMLFERERLVEQGDVLRLELAPEDARRLADGLMAAAAGMPVLSGDVSVRGQG